MKKTIIVLCILIVSCENKRDTIIDREIALKHQIDSLQQGIEDFQAKSDWEEQSAEMYRTVNNLNVDSVNFYRAKTLKWLGKVDSLKGIKKVLLQRYDSLEMEMRKYQK